MNTRSWTEGHTRQHLATLASHNGVSKGVGATVRLLLLSLVAALVLIPALPAVSQARSMYVVNDRYVNPDPDDHFIKFTISQYDIDPATEALASFGLPMVDVGARPRSIAVSPDGKNAYVANSLTLYWASISQYDIDPATGALTAKSSPTAASDGRPQDIAISPDGKSAYIVNVGSASIAGGHSISQYDIDPATGALSQKSPAAVESGAYPTAVAVNPDGKSAYVTNGDNPYSGSTGANTVSQYDIDPATGELSPKGSPTVAAGSNPDAIAVRPDGKNVYAANGRDNTISQYDIEATGELTQKGGPAPATGSWPVAVTVSPDGTDAYVANRGGNNVSQYSIDPGGSLSASGTAAAGVKPTAVSVSPNGIGAYVTNENNDGNGTVSQYGIDPSTGGLSPMSTATVAAGLWPQDIAIQPNQGPTAQFTVDAGLTGEPTTFDASGSADPDGSIDRYDWDFGDGTAVEDAGPVPSHTYSSSGGYDVTLTVIDDEGCSSEVVFNSRTAYCNGSPSATASESVTVIDPTPSPVPAPSPPAPPGPAPSSAVQTATFSEACNLKITSPRMGTSKTKVLSVTTKQARRLFTHGVKGTMRWGKVNGKDVVCKKVKMAILQQRGKSYYIPGTRTRVSKKILTGKTFSTRGAGFLKKKKVGRLHTKARSSKRQTKISYKDFNRRSKLGRRALNNLRKRGYRGKFLVLYSAEIGGTTVLKSIRLGT